MIKLGRSNLQKAKLLLIEKYLNQKTNEDNGVTIDDIKKHLESFGVSSERKSLYGDLDVLKAYGLDICKMKKNTKCYYYIAQRDFQTAELKMLVDIIQSSKFVTEKKSFELIAKLEKLVCESDAKKLNRQVYVCDRIKHNNEHIYYNVDKLHNAIDENKAITFQYFHWQIDYNSSPKIVKSHKKGIYEVSPWKLCWNNDNYYLIAYDHSSKETRHYRVDKMNNIELTQNERQGKELFDKDFLSKYTNTLFGMYGGKNESVTLKVKNEKIGIVVDRFGSEIMINKCTEDTFKVTINIALSPQFYSWIFGFNGDAKIISPEYALNEYNNMLKNLYNSQT